MNEPESTRSPRRRNADYRWTSSKALAFLDALAMTGSVAQAARSVGMSRQSAYRLRARLGEAFGAVWDEGLALGHVMRQVQGRVPQGDIRGRKVASGPAR